MNSEPVSITAGILALVTAILGLCVGKGWISESDSAAILGIVAAAIGLGGYIVRRKVWSQKSFDAFVAEPAAEGD